MRRREVCVVCFVSPGAARVKPSSVLRRARKLRVLDCKAENACGYNCLLLLILDPKTFLIVKLKEF